MEAVYISENFKAWIRVVSYGETKKYTPKYVYNALS